MAPARLETVFRPGEIEPAHTPICVMVDAIRSSCTIVTLLEKRFGRIHLAAGAEPPGASAEGLCVCAEKVGGGKADDADVGPSLVELAGFPDGVGDGILLRTTNGTRGLHIMHEMGAKEIYIGCLLNIDAVAEAVVRRSAATGNGVCIVGAGRENGTIYCLDDAYCCAVMIEKILAGAEQARHRFHVQDSAKIALGLTKNYASPEEAFVLSASAAVMRRAGAEADIFLCAKCNTSTIVPKVEGYDRFGRLVVEAS